MRRLAVSETIIRIVIDSYNKGQASSKLNEDRSIRLLGPKDSKITSPCSNPPITGTRKTYVRSHRYHTYERTQIATSLQMPEGVRKVFEEGLAKLQGLELRVKLM